MPKFIDNIFKIINKIFSNKNMLEQSQSEKFLQDVLKAGVIRDYINGLERKLDLKKLDIQYSKKLGDGNILYNLELKSKLTEQQTLELAKKFFSSLGTDFAKKSESVIDGTSTKFKFITELYGQTIENGQPREPELKDFNEIFCPMRGDLRDLYSVVHEVTHSMDLEKGETEARTIFGEIAPQCMERLLDEFLLNMSDNDIQKYGFNRDILIRDVRHRIVSTFLDRKDITRDLNRGTYFDKIDKTEKAYSFGEKRGFLRYTLAQIYSTEFMKIPENTRTDALRELMKNIQDDKMALCSKSFGVDLFNKVKMDNILNDVTEVVKRKDHMIVEKESLEKILEQYKLGKDLMKKIPQIKGAHGILSCNEKIISNNMNQGKKIELKNNDKVL